MLKVIYIWGNFRKCYNFLNKNDVMKKDESLNRNCEELIMREDWTLRTWFGITHKKEEGKVEKLKWRLLQEA